MLKVKLLSSVLVSVGLAAGIGFFFSKFAPGSDLLSLAITVVFAVFYLAIFLVRVLFVQKWWIALALIVAEMAAVSIFLLPHAPTIWVICGAVAAIVVLFIAHWRGTSEISNVIKIHFRNFQYMVLSTAIIGLTLFGIVVYLSSISAKEIYVGKEPVSYVVKFFPSFSEKISFGSLVERFVQKTNEQLPPETVNFIAFNANQKISEIIGVNLNPQENIIDIGQKIINGLLAKAPREFKVFIIVGLGVLIFFTINSGTFLFSWVIGFIAWLIYRLILTTNFARITLEKSQKEKVSL